MKYIMSIFISLVLIFSLVPQAKAANADFKDVPKNHANYAEIMFLLERGVIEPKEKFGVNEKVTREEVAVMLSKALGLDGKQTTTKFKDVPLKLSSSGYINSAVKDGIIYGYPDGTFKPKQYVTRGQMASFISRAFKLSEQSEVNFKDMSPKASSYVAVRQIVYANITTGYGDGTFRPNANLTRGHIAAFIARSIKNTSNKIPPLLSNEAKAMKYLKDSGEYKGNGNDLFVFQIKDNVVEISYVNNYGNPYLNRWLFKDGKIIDQLWKNNVFNDQYTENPLLGGILLPIPNPNKGPVSKGTLELYGHDGEYLGLLTTNRYLSDSVFNEYGTYGSKYSNKSIWNKYGTYGGEYSSNGAFNKYSTKAPRMVLDGQIIGYVTANSYTYLGIHPNNLYDVLKEAGY